MRRDQMVRKFQVFDFIGENYNLKIAKKFFQFLTLKINSFQRLFFQFQHTSFPSTYWITSKEPQNQTTSPLLPSMWLSLSMSLTRNLNNCIAKHLHMLNEYLKIVVLSTFAQTQNDTCSLNKWEKNKHSLNRIDESTIVLRYRQ